MCRTHLSKQEGLRVVRTPEGAVQFDPTGKQNGRGAYVCSVACFEKALQKKRFAAALRTKISEEDYERIANEVCFALSQNKA